MINNTQLVQMMLILEHSLLEVFFNPNIKVKAKEIRPYTWDIGNKIMFINSDQVEQIISELEILYKEIMHRLKRDGKFKYQKKQIIIQSKMNML